MSQPHLIRTKLHPPRVKSPLVDRPRLAGRMDAHPGRVILVSAPAGFGKTVLVTDWLSRQEALTAWLSLDSLDNDPSRFCAHLAAAVEGLQVKSASRVAEIIRGLPLPDLPLPPAFLPTFLEMGPEPVMVLDDLHELDSAGALGVVEALVNIPGPGPRLVILTREDPPFATGRLRVAGELLEIRAKDLRFTDDETLQLFDRLLPGGLDPAQVRRLDQRTEGWVAGLRLAAIALHDAENPGALVESFAGNHRFVMDYLVEEALERQPPALQQFLLDTSILSRFNPDTCISVTGDPEARNRLREVERANLFLVPLGRDGEWYRYHHLFAELLRFRLEHQQGDRLEELHGRASSWFEVEGDTAAAMEHASHMNDQTRLLELLDAHALEMLGRSEMAGLRHWTGKVRDPLSQAFPMVICIIGWLQVVTDRAPNLEPILRGILDALERVGPGYDPARKRRAALHVAVLSAYSARYARRYEEALRISEETRGRFADADPFTQGLLTYNTARVRMALGDMEAAAGLLETAFGDHLRSGNLYLTLATMGRSAAVVAQVEGVRPAREALAAAMDFARERGLARNPAFSIILFHRGHVEYLGDELEPAQSSFESAVELAGAQDFPEERGNALVGLARVALARGRFDEAESLLLEAASLAQGSNMDLVDTTLELERARLAMAREAAGVGPPIPPIDPGMDSGPWDTIRETEITLALQQALRSERYSLVERWSGELQRESGSRSRGPSLCTALLARVLLPELTDRWETLDQALRLAATRGYIRPLLDVGPPLREVLRAGLTRVSSPAARGHARLILQRLDDEPALAPGRTETRLVDPLTDREEEVLACLFRGQSNRDIARSIFVSVDTVKTHLKHIYDKLGVSDRTAAVNRARELGFGPDTES